MWQAIVILLGCLVLYSAVFRGLAALRRRRGSADVNADDIVRVARRVKVKVLIQGVRHFRGLNPRRTNRVTADLVVTDTRCVLASDRGVLVELGPDRGRRFSSVRCTGPSLLVLEGVIPGADGRGGMYRIEMSVRDAEVWAHALAAFADDVIVPDFNAPAVPGHRG